MAELWRRRTRRSVVSRLREANHRPHYVVCGQDALVVQVVKELLKEAVRVTVVVPVRRRAEGPDVRAISGIRVLVADRLDEDTFRAAGLRGAASLALLHQDDVGNIHAALCAQEIEPNIRIVMRMFNMSLGYRVKHLFPDCQVMSDAAMAAPAFVAAALGEVAPTYFRHGGRSLFVARRGDVRPEAVVCGLADLSDPENPALLPPDDSRADLVLAEANGKHPATDLPARRLARLRRRQLMRRPITVVLRALRSFVTRKIGIATLAVLAVVAIAGYLLSHLEPFSSWQAVYLALITTFSGADPEPDRPVAGQIVQIVLTLSGLALIPLITAAVVDGIVNARLVLDRGRLQADREGHIVVIGLGNVGTRVIRQLHDLGFEVVAIDKNPDARGAAIAEQLDIPFIIGDAARSETLRMASVGKAQALVVVTTDDVTNLEAALNAREMTPDLHVVLRLYDNDLAERIQRVFGIGVSRSVSHLAAPTFAAAMLDREVLATLPVERELLLVAEVTVAANSPLVGQPIVKVNHPHLVRVIAYAGSHESRPDWTPRRQQRLAAGDRLTVVAPKVGLNWLLRRITPPSSNPDRAG
ncbi:MAG TPA: TrkA family potassium uptake protein [Micromonosporaceae bacterium]